MRVRLFSGLQHEDSQLITTAHVAVPLGSPTRVPFIHPFEEDFCDRFQGSQPLEVLKFCLWYGRKINYTNLKV